MSTWTTVRRRTFRRSSTVPGILILVAMIVSLPLPVYADDDDDDEDEVEEVEEVVEAVSPLIAYTAVAKTPRPSERYPRLEGELELELENDATYRSQDPESEVNSLFARTEAEIALRLTPSFSVESELTFQPIEDADDGRIEERLRSRDDSPDNREFDAHSLFVEQLLARWRGESFEVHVGKFNPRFGKAFEFEVGPFGDEDDFAEDYALEERIGGGASFTFETEEWGTHVASAESFFLDTSNLARSALFQRGGLKRSDGGPSNTGSPNSFGFALEGEELLIEGLGYNLGFVYQKGGRRGPFPRGIASGGDDEDEGDDIGELLGDDDDDEDEAALRRDRGSLERDYAAGLTYEFSAADELDVDLLTEYVYIDNADGENGRLRRFFTLSGRTTWNNVRFGLSYTLRTEAIPMDSDKRDFLFLSSIGYFRPVGEAKIGLETGFRIVSSDNQRGNTVALRLSYELEF